MTTSKLSKSKWIVLSIAAIFASGTIFTQVYDTSTTLRRSLQLSESTNTKEKYLGLILPEEESMPLYLRNTMELVPRAADGQDLIFYWHVPKAGGQLMKNIMSVCYGLRRAERLKEPASLEMVHEMIVNVDTSTPEGIQEARDLHLADSGKVDVIASSFVLSASSLFNANHRGRAFTILRHPVDNAASLFWTRKQLRPDLRVKYTLAQYAMQDWYPDNWVTRQLTGTLPHEELSQIHLDRAKNILSNKFFVGISDQMEESLRQLKAYYGWQPVPGREHCVPDLLHGGNPKFVKSYNRPLPSRGSDDWRVVANRERYDMELYYFALELFARQGVMYSPGRESYD
eukprot:g1631.t1 g1631   contig10:2473250-2474278(-)